MKDKITDIERIFTTTLTQLAERYQDASWGKAYDAVDGIIVSCHNRRVSACYGARTNPSRARKQAEFLKKLQNISKSLLTRFFLKTAVFPYQPQVT